jgi:transposase-like protein
MAPNKPAARGTKQARCQVCHSSVSLHYGTAFYELHVDPAWFALAVRALAEGSSLRATGRIVQIGDRISAEQKTTSCYYGLIKNWIVALQLAITAL